MAAVPVMDNERFSHRAIAADQSAHDQLGDAVLDQPQWHLIIDTTQAYQNETSTITVTATDPANGTKTTQSFVVTVGAYGGPTQVDLTLNFRPFANELRRDRRRKHSDIGPVQLACTVIQPGPRRP